MLLFQEQIQGPKNASIARFDGLCCYQNSSEKSAKAAQLDALAGKGQLACGQTLNRFRVRATWPLDGLCRLPMSGDSDLAQRLGPARDGRQALLWVNDFIFESKFKHPKTPASHGLTDFAATKTVAKRLGDWAGGKAVLKQLPHAQLPLFLTGRKRHAAF